MDRRHFFNYISAFGIDTSLPALGHHELRVGVVGIGGAGANVLRYLREQLPNLNRTVAINSDACSLRRQSVDQKIQVKDIPDEPSGPDFERLIVVRENAWSVANEIAGSVAGLDMVFLVAGMGGLAGTVISPIVGQILREQNIFTLGFPILPFEFEGQRRCDIARHGAAEFGRHVDSLIPIHNDTFAQAAGESAMMDDVFNQISLSVLQHYLRVTGAVAVSRHAGTDRAVVMNRLSNVSCN